MKNVIDEMFSVPRQPLDHPVGAHLVQTIRVGNAYWEICQICGRQWRPGMVIEDCKG